MSDQRLNKTGLAYFYNRLKTIFASKSALEALAGRVDDIVTTGGEPNVIEAVLRNGTALPVSGMAVDVTVPTKVSQLTNDSGFQTADQVRTAISSAVASAYRYKGSVATYAGLPASPAAGDVYDVQETGMNYAWNGSAWDALGQLIDTSSLWTTANLTAITTAEIDAIVV